MSVSPYSRGRTQKTDGVPPWKTDDAPNTMSHQTTMNDETLLKTAIAKKIAEDEERKTGPCCLCDKQYENWGNNPYPLCHEDDGDSRCCEACNTNKVLPARMVELFKKDYLKRRLAEARAVRRLAGRR